MAGSAPGSPFRAASGTVMPRCGAVLPRRPSAPLSSSALAARRERVVEPLPRRPDRRAGAAGRVQPGRDRVADLPPGGPCGGPAFGVAGVVGVGVGAGGQGGVDELEALGVQVAAQVPARPVGVRDERQPAVAVLPVGRVLQPLRPQRVVSMPSADRSSGRPGGRACASSRNAASSRSSCDVGQHATSLSSCASSSTRGSSSASPPERAAHLVQHPVRDDRPDDGFGGLAVQQPVGPVQVRPQVRQHLRDQRPGRHGQPAGQHRLLHRRRAGPAAERSRRCPQRRGRPAPATTPTPSAPAPAARAAGPRRHRPAAAAPGPPAAGPPATRPGRPSPAARARRSDPTRPHRSALRAATRSGARQQEVPRAPRRRFP